MMSQETLVSSDNTIRSTVEQEEVMSYDEFRLMLEGNGQKNLAIEGIIAGDGDEDDEVVTNVKKYSFVARWRRRIDPIEIGPPATPLSTSEFPSSPVAVVHPTQLRVTSLPPYDLKTASKLAGTSSESSTETIIDRPTHFHDLYDVELECMIDEADEVESSAPSVSLFSAAVYIPPTRSEQTLKGTAKKNISSVIRWLPARIKYTFLSSANMINKGFRK